MPVVSTTQREMEEIVSKAKDELLLAVRCFPEADIAKIEQAIDFSYEAHNGQFRASGEPYIIHPIAVARIVLEQKLDPTSVISALLHDTIEDTPVQYKDIVNAFGEEVAKIVEGVTKLTKVEYQPVHIQQADNFRKLLLALSKDIRALLVKLADRVHNMRTINCIADKEKRIRIAQETMDVYSPLAERMGIHQFKNELQDLAFATLFPEIRTSITSRLEYFRIEGKEEMDNIRMKLLDILGRYDIKAEVSCREKTCYSIWHKMERKGLSFEQLSDIVAFRILVPTTLDCYKALGAIHSEYKCVPKGFKDYISIPKENGYKSLHTLVFGFAQRKTEIQIRTYEMHEIAELGLAVHWAYKQGENNIQIESSKFKWIQELVEILQQTNSPEELLENTRMDMYNNQVFCFTPNGKLIPLPRGATPVDFAFALHSKLGLLCAGAKVNGKVMSLNTKLQNGDQIEVLLNKTPAPSSSWENFVITGKARASLRKFMKSAKKNELTNLGRVMLMKALQKSDSSYNEKAFIPILKKFQKKTVDDLLLAVGRGLITKTDVIAALSSEASTHNKQKNAFSLLSIGQYRRASKMKDVSTDIPIQGLLPGDHAYLADCCTPIPGDKIVGILHPEQLIAIHMENCNAITGRTNPDCLDLTWGRTGGISYPAKIKVNLLNQEGNFFNLFKVIADAGFNVSNLQVVFRSEESFEILVELEVQGAHQLNDIINAIKSLELVYGAERFKQ